VRFSRGFSESPDDTVNKRARTLESLITAFNNPVARSYERDWNTCIEMYERPCGATHLHRREMCVRVQQCNSQKSSLKGFCVRYSEHWCSII